MAIGVLRPAGGTQRRRQRDGKFAASAEAERDSRAPRRSLRSEETPAPPEVERLLGEALRLSASDLHLHVGAMPLLRIDGELREILPEHLPLPDTNRLPAPPAQLSEKSPSAEQPLTLAEVEKRHILGVLERAQGNRTHAAKLLGIGRNTLGRKLKEYGLAE